MTSTCSGGARSVTPDEDVTWDVTALLASGAAPSFALVSTDSDGAHFYSSQSGGCALGPHLLVVNGPPPPTDAGPPPVEDAGSPPVDTDAGVAPVVDAGNPEPTDAGVHVPPVAEPDAGARVDGGSTHGPESITGTSCGCASGGASPLPLMGVFFATLALRIRRRR